MKRALFGVIVIVGAITAGQLVQTSFTVAASNDTINFQARILQSNGAVVADGAYNVEFKIYDSASSGASAQGVCSLDSSSDDCWWVESYTGVNKIVTKNGYITASLGELNAFRATIPWDRQLYITMNIGGTGAPSWDGEMTPRMKITSVPFALTAGKLQAADSGFVSTLGFISPTANRTINIPNASGTLLLDSTLTTEGDLLYRNATTVARLARGSDGECLKSNSSSILWGSCGATGSSTTLQGAYDAGTSGDQVVQFASANDSVIFRNPASSGSDSAFVLKVEQLNAGAGIDSLIVSNSGTGNILTLQNGSTTVLGITSNGNLVANGASTATTGTTEATARTNVTTVTLTAAGSFANNDIIFINNAGQDYYTRIVSGGGTTTLTVSPAVSYDVSAAVTKYNVQNIGATSTDYTTLSNRFFQGYFLGGVVTGAGSTTLSDGSLTSTGNLILQGTANNVGIGIQNPSYKLDVNGTSNFSNKMRISINTDVSATDDASGSLVIGVVGGNNIGIDGNEIASRNNNVASLLLLNAEGGLVQVGDGGLKVATRFNVDSNGYLEVQDASTAAGTAMIKVGDDSFLTDIDSAHTLGVYSNSDTTRGTIRLGSSGPSLAGTSTGLAVSDDITVTGSLYSSINNSSNTVYAAEFTNSTTADTGTVMSLKFSNRQCYGDDTQEVLTNHIFVALRMGSNLGGRIDGFGNSNAGDCNGTNVRYGTSAADFAEHFYSPRTLNDRPGLYEIAAVGDDGNARQSGGSIATKPLIGVISNTAGFVGNGPICREDAVAECDSQYAQDNVLVGLTGQLKVKVNSEGGVILAGDPIGASSLRGVGKKMLSQGYIVGYALESDSDGDGLVRIKLNTEYYQPSDFDVIQADTLRINNSANISSSLNVAGMATLSGGLFVSGDTKLIGNVQVEGDITIAGNLIVQDASVNNLTINGHIITAGATPLAIPGLALGEADLQNAIAAPSVSVHGNDTAGTITIVAGARTIKGEMANVQFSNPFAESPRAIISAKNEDSAAIQLFNNTQIDKFTLYSVNAPLAGRTYIFDYYIIQ